MLSCQHKWWTCIHGSFFFPSFFFSFFFSFLDFKQHFLDIRLVRGFRLYKPLTVLSISETHTSIHRYMCMTRHTCRPDLIYHKITTMQVALTRYYNLLNSEFLKPGQDVIATVVNPDHHYMRWWWWWCVQKWSASPFHSSALLFRFYQATYLGPWKKETKPLILRSCKKYNNMRRKNKYHSWNQPNSTLLNRFVIWHLWSYRPWGNSYCIYSIVFMLIFGQVIDALV